MENKVLFPGVKDGEVFRVGDIDFIKFPSEGDVTPVVAKDVLFNSEFGRDNNFSCSTVLKRMQEEILPILFCGRQTKGGWRRKGCKASGTQGRGLSGR